MPRASATLTVWATAWLHGRAAADDLLDALHTWAPRHDVCAVDEDTARSLGLPAPDGQPTSPAGLLAAARRLGADGGRLLLPVPGDVRGLAADNRLTPAAVSVGEAAVLTGADVALVPEATTREATWQALRWTVFRPGALPPAAETSLPEAEHGLRDAVRRAAASLGELDVARDRPAARAEISDRLDQRVQPPWPVDVPARVLRVWEQADRVETILTAAEQDEPGGAVSASAARSRGEALRPLWTVVRDARRAATAEAVRVVSAHAGRY